MSEKNEIDELFRRTLGDKGLEYAPDYWVQMEALMGKRKRRMLKTGVWVSALLLLCVSAVFLMDKVEVDKLEAKADDQAQVQAKTEVAEQETPLTTKEINKPVPAAAEPAPSKAKPTPDPLSSSPAPLTSSSPAPITSSSPDPHTSSSRHPLTPSSPDPHTYSSPHLIPSSPALLSIEPLTAKKPELTLKPNSPSTVQNHSRRLPSFTQWYLEGFFNHGVVKHRTADAAMRDWKSDNEKVLPYTQYGLNARVARGHLSLSLGAGIRQWTERTNYTKEFHHYTFDTSLKLVTRQFIQRPDGTYAALIQQQIDTVSHTTTREVVCRDCPVEFRYISIPLALQYEFAKGRWSYYTGAGVTFSILSKGSGEYSVQWDQTAGGMRTSGSAGTYFAKTVVQAGASLGFRYRLLPSLSLGGHLNYQASVNSMMIRYRQQADFYGMGLGLEWKLY